MLSVKKLSSSSEAGKYYDKADYYTKGESGVDISSSWHGEGAESLGLSGAVEKEEFVNILEGKLPNNQSLQRPSGDRVPGWDFTFSAPKSLSLLALIGDDERLLKAHFDAVKETLSFAEKEFLVTRMKQNGQLKTTSTEKLVAGLFTHTTSRALDPQLHTHSVIANATEGPDGKWRSIESKPLFNNKMLLGQVYRAELAMRAQELGYEINWDRQRGTFEIKGVEQYVIDHFSKRRKEIKEYAEKKGLEGGKEMADATLKTRSSKQDMASEQVILSWDKSAKEIAFNPSELVQNAKEAARNTTKSTTLSNVEKVVRFAYRNLSFNEAVFTRQNLLQESFLFSRGEISVQQITQAIDSLVHKKELINAQLNGVGQRQLAYTTPKAVEIEQHNLQLLSLGMNELGSIARQSDITKGIENYNQKNPDKKLQPEQAETVIMALSSKDRVSGIQGYAGVGKSTSLRAFREIAEHRGYNVKGYAPTGKAAQELEKSAGIRSNTVDSLLETLNKADSLNDMSGDIWVVDESSMSNSRHFNQLLNYSRKTNARILVVGDKAQLSAVEQGKPFEQLQDEGMAVQVMSNIQRQKNEHIRAAVVSSINGNITNAFKSIQASNSKDTNVFEIKNSKTRGIKVAEHYVSLIEEAIKNGKTYDDAINQYVKLIIPDNAGRRDTNKVVRKLLQEKNIIGKDQVKTFAYINTGMKPEERADALKYQKGYVVRFLQDNKSLGVTENSYYKVESIDNDNKHVHLVDRNGNKVKWNPDKQGGREQYGVSVYEATETKLAEGDYIRWRDKNEQAGLKNADIGKVLSIEKNRAKLQLKNGNIINIDLEDERYKHFEHEYASTVYATQGDTYQKVVAQLDSNRKNLVNQKSFYVALSRAVTDISIYTDNLSKTTKTIESRSGSKTSALEGIGYSYDKITKSNMPGVVSVPHTNNLDDSTRDAIAELSIQEAVFSRNDLIKRVIKNTRGTYSVDLVNSSIDRLHESSEIRSALLKGQNQTVGAFTTNQAIVEEWRNVEYVKRGINQAGKMADEKALHTVLNSGRFSESQQSVKDALTFVLTNSDRISGLSVSGRENQINMIDNLGSAIAQRGFNVKALNISGKQVNQIHNETGIQSHTLSSFLFRMEKNKSDVKNDVWLVDQSQMLSSNDFGRILSAADKQQARVIFTGDTKETGAINKGRPYQQLIDAGMRHHTWKHDLNNSIDAQVSRLFSNATEIKDKDERLHNAVEHYVSLSETERNSHIFWIPSSDKRDLANSKIRKLLAKSGRLGKNNTAFNALQRVGLNLKESSNPMNFSAGMTIKVHSDNSSVGLKKGSYYQVVERNLTSITIKDGEHKIQVDSTELEKIANNGMSVYQDKKLDIAKGEKIRWKESNQRIGLNSGDLITIQSVTKTGAIGKLSNGEVVTLNSDDMSNRHFDYAYTGNHFDISFGRYKSATAIIESHRKNLLSQKTVSTLMSAVTGEIRSFTDSKDRSINAIHERLNDKQSALDGAGIKERITDFNRAKVSSATHTNISEKEAINKAVGHLYNNNAVFKRTEVLKTAIMFSGHSHEKLNAELDRQLQNGDLVQSDLVHDGLKHEAMVTTKSAYRREGYMLEVLKRGIGDKREIGKKGQLEKISNEYGFNESQERVATHLLFNKDSVVAVQGGMSNQLNETLKAFGEVAKNNKYNVTGYTPRSELTEQFKGDTGIESKNIQSLITSLNNMKKKPSLKNDVWIVNEAGMLSTKEMADLLTLGRQTGARIVLTGDVKQNASMGQGMPMKQLLDNGLKSESLYVNDVSKSKTTRLAWSDAFAGKASKALEKLGGDIKEIPEENERINQVISDYLQVPPENRKDYMIVVASNKVRDKATKLLREGLKNEGRLSNTGVQTNVLENANLSKEQRGVAVFYEAGMHVRFNKDFSSLGVKKGDYCRVLKAEKDVVQLVAKDGKIISWKPNKVAGATERGVSVFRERNVEVSEGDSLRWKEKNNKLGKKTGDIVHVKQVNEHEMLVVGHDGKSHKIDTSDPSMKHFSHSYVETYLSSQGAKGVKYIFGVIESYQKRLLNQKSFFTVLNKAKERFYGYVDDRSKVKKQLEKVSGDKLNAMDLNKKNKVKALDRFNKSSSEPNNKIQKNRTDFMKKLGDKLFGPKSKTLSGPDI